MSGFSINRIVLSGNLTRDPELRSLPSGTSVANLRIANNTRRKNPSTGDWEDKPNYFNVTLWGNFGEAAIKDLAKGDGVVVEGRMEWREYEPEGSERKVQVYDVIADSLVRLARGGGGGGRRDPADPGPDEPYGSDVPADTSGLDAEAAPAKGGPDDDIPF